MHFCLDAKQCAFALVPENAPLHWQQTMLICLDSRPCTFALTPGNSPLPWQQTMLICLDITVLVFLVARQCPFALTSADSLTKCHHGTLLKAGPVPDDGNIDLLIPVHMCVCVALSSWTKVLIASIHDGRLYHVKKYQKCVYSETCVLRLPQGPIKSGISQMVFYWRYKYIKLSVHISAKVVLYDSVSLHWS